MIWEIHRVLKPSGKLVLTTYNHSLRKIVGRKKETPKTAILYAYRYNYFELKRTLSSVFENGVKITGILNLLHWIPKNLLNRYKNVLAMVDFLVERVPLCYFTAHLLLAECTKKQ